MARPSANSPEKIARVVSAVKAGLPLRSAAAQFGVSHGTVKRWADAAKASEAPPLVPAPPEPAEPAAPPPDDLPEDPVALLRLLLREVREAANAARHAGNHVALQSAMSNLTKLAPILTRAEKQAGETSDHARFSKAEIEKASASARAKLEAYLARPLQCATCSRELSVAWGSGAPAKVADPATGKS